VVNNAAPPQIGIDTFMHLTYADPQWDWRNFDLGRDTAPTSLTPWPRWSGGAKPEHRQTC
jgi:hypothetical protein